MAEIIGIDQALNDFLIETDTESLKKMGLRKGDRQRITEDKLREAMPLIEKSTPTPGGTITNVLKNLVSFGETAGIIAAVGDDELGQTYKQSLVGLEDLTKTLKGKTGMAITYSTEDGQVSYQTYLGVSTQLPSNSVEVLDKKILDETKMFVMSGFLFEDNDTPLYGFTTRAVLKYYMNTYVGKALVLRGTDLMKEKADQIRGIMQTYEISILSLGEEEAKIISRSKNYIESAKDLINLCQVVVITRGNSSVFVKTRDGEYEAGIVPLEKSEMKNSNGASDAVLASIIYESVNFKFRPKIAARMAAYMAREAMRSDSASISGKVDYGMIRKVITSVD